MKHFSILLLATAASGCMVQERSIERSPGPWQAAKSPPLAGSERRYALILERTDLLELRVRAVSLCELQSARKVRRTEVERSRPNGSRFIGAAAALAGGSILLARGDANTPGATLLTVGAGIVFIPIASAEESRRSLHPSTELANGVRLVPCSDRPVHGARVAVRIGARTLEATSDVAGRVRFFDDRPSPDAIVYVDDVAVSVRVGTPVTGTPQPEEGPARPDPPAPR